MDPKSVLTRARKGSHSPVRQLETIQYLFQENSGKFDAGRVSTGLPALYCKLLLCHSSG